MISSGFSKLVCVKEDKMEIETLKAKIEDTYGMDEFRDLLHDQASDKEFDAVVGLPLTFLEKKQDYQGDDCWDEIYRFRIGDKIYEVHGHYSSWESGGIENMHSFYEVRPVQKTITVYEPV